MMPKFCFTFEVITDAEIQLDVILNKVDQWLRTGFFKTNSDKKDCILATKNNSMHRIFHINSVLLSNNSVQLSTGARNHRFLFDNEFHLNEKINNVKRKVIVNLISISRLQKLLEKTQK